MIINENSLYSNSAERAALVADKEKVASAFFINVLGTLGIFAITSKRAAMKTHFQEDGKLRLHAIGDANKDVSLTIKLFHEVGGIRRSVADSLTKLLVNIKQKKIDHKNLNEQLIRDLVNNIQFNAHRPHPEVYKVVKAFANGELSLQQTGKEMYLTVKRKKKELLSVAGEFYELAKQYQPYFSNMKDATLAQAQAQIQAPAQVQQQPVASTAPVAVAQVPTVVPVAAPTPKAAAVDKTPKMSLEEERLRKIHTLWNDPKVQRSGDILTPYADAIGQAALTKEDREIFGKFFMPSKSEMSQYPFLSTVRAGYKKGAKILKDQTLKNVLIDARQKEYPAFHFISSLALLEERRNPEHYSNWFHIHGNGMTDAYIQANIVGFDVQATITNFFEAWAEQIIDTWIVDCRDGGFMDRFDEQVDDFDRWASLVGYPKDHEILFSTVSKGRLIEFLLFYVASPRKYQMVAADKLIAEASKLGITIKKVEDTNGTLAALTSDNWDGLYSDMDLVRSKWAFYVKFTKPVEMKSGSSIDGWSGVWNTLDSSEFKIKLKEIEESVGSGNIEAAGLYGDVVVNEFDANDGDQLDLITRVFMVLGLQISNGEHSEFKMAFFLRLMLILGKMWGSGKWKKSFLDVFAVYLMSTGIRLSSYTRFSDSIARPVYALMKPLEQNEEFMRELAEHVFVDLMRDNWQVANYIIKNRPLVGKAVTKYLMETGKLGMDDVIRSIGLFHKYLSHEDWRAIIEYKHGPNKNEWVSMRALAGTITRLEIPLVDMFTPEELVGIIGQFLGSDSTGWVNQFDMEIIDSLSGTLKGDYAKLIADLMARTCLDGKHGSYRKIGHFDKMLSREDMRRVFENESDARQDDLLMFAPSAYMSSMPSAVVEERLRRMVNINAPTMSWFDAAESFEKYGDSYSTEIHKLMLQHFATNINNGYPWDIKKNQESTLIVFSSLRQRGDSAAINEMVKLFDDKTQRHIYRELVREKAFGLMAHELYHGDSLVKPLKALTNEEIRGVMKYNDISFNVPAMSKKLSFAENIDAKAEKLQVEDQSIDQIETSDEDLKRMSAHFDTFCNRKHGDIAVKFKRAFNVNLKSQQENYTKFLGDMAAANADANVKVPMFHGCGTVAASMILRYGFKIIKMDRNAKGGVAMAGRALGDGIYFTNVLDKASLYVGDKGYNRGGRPGAKGYMFEMSCALGIPKKHTVAASTGSKYDIRRDFISPEWCARNLEQIVIHKAYEVEIITRGDMERIKKEVKAMSETNESEVVKDFKKFISESMDYKFRNQNATTFVFYDGMFPTEDGKVVAADKANLKLPKNAVMDWTKHGPAVIFYGGETTQAYDVEYIGDFANTSAGAHFYHLMGWKLPDEQ